MNECYLFSLDSNLFKGWYTVEKIFHFLVGSEHLWNLWRSICILLKHVINFFLTVIITIIIVLIKRV